MEKTTAKLTKEYIDEHPHIKSCLKKGIINYSSLSRLIANELEITKKTSIEAISIAAIRYEKEINNNNNQEEKVKNLLLKSEIEVKNKIMTIVTNKNINLDKIKSIEDLIKEDFGLLYYIEGSSNYIFIIQEKYQKEIEDILKNEIIHKKQALSIIILKSPLEIELTPGVISYLTSLFAENSINIVEFLSCYKDTLFIIESKDAPKVFEIMNF